MGKNLKTASGWRRLGANGDTAGAVSIKLAFATWKRLSAYRLAQAESGNIRTLMQTADELVRFALDGKEKS